MDKKEVEYLQGLLEIFKIEAQEHLSAMSKGLMELEKANASEQGPLVETIYREAHSLKGAARAVNMGEVESVCQKLESVFAEMKRTKVPASPPLFDALHRAVTELDAIMQTPHTPRSVAEKARTQKTCRDLESAALRLFGSPTPTAPPVDTPAETPEPDVPPHEPIQRKPHKAPPAAAMSQAPAADAPPQQLPGSELQHPSVVKPAERSDDWKPGPTGEGNEGALRSGSSPVSPDPQPLTAIQDARSKIENRTHAPGQDAETIRVSTSKLDALLLQAEELLSARLTAGYRAAELLGLTVTLSAWSREWAKVRADVRAMQQVTERDTYAHHASQRVEADSLPLKSLLEFLNWNQTFIKSLETSLIALSKAAEHDQATLEGMTDTLLEDVKKVLMLPFASLLETFPKMARDISRSRGKEVELVIRGGEIEIDRRILEALKDPLIHLLRNCIDHGIEEPQERLRRGKPQRGTLTIAVAQRDANKIEVLISDDGAGIDTARVLAAAARSGLLAERDDAASEGASDAAALSLIFQSGFSTSPIITDLSGRGLGLAIVREKVEKLGGTVLVESQPGAGTGFRLVLPLTLATCRAILVQSGGRLFVLPTTHVERVMGVHASDIKHIGSRETIMVDGEPVSLARLSDTLGVTQNGATLEPGTVMAGASPAILLEAADKRVAFLVDAILDEQEVLVKSLGPQLVRVRNIAGATVLGSGKVAPILNVVDLLKSSLQAGRGPARGSATTHAGEPLAAPATKRKSILVAEDSITSRTLFKNILEAAGYVVKTAIDGMDALGELRAAEYDLLVSDIEMPRMNGLDLTAEVRADQGLADLPVVLVTSLESREDRERGAEVGANAYLVKRGFDQGTLLETISRLI